MEFKVGMNIETLSRKTPTPPNNNNDKNLEPLVPFPNILQPHHVA
jgi:hypothetical protein